MLQLRSESIVLLLLCVLLWAGQSVAAKVATNSLPTFQVMAIRFAIPVLCIPLFALTLGMSLRLPKQLIPSMLLNGSFLLIQIALFTSGTSMTTSNHSVVLINSFPFFAALACHLFLPNIQLKPRFLLGFLVAFCGLLSVLSDDLSWFGAKTWRGDLLIICAAATMGLKIALVKSMLAKTKPVAMVFWECVIALPVTVCLSLQFEVVEIERYLGWPTLLALAYQGFAVSTVAFLAWTRLLQMHDPGQLVLYRLLTPLFGLLLGWLILHEQLSFVLVTGAILVVTGIFIVSGKASPQAQNDHTLTQM